MTLHSSWSLLVSALFLLFGGSGGAPHAPRPQFSAHVSFATPSHSFSHGVGAPPRAGGVGTLLSRTAHGNYRSPLTPRLRANSFRSLQGLPDESTLHFRNEGFQGYPRERPSIPFHHYSHPADNSHSHGHVTFGDNSLGHIDTLNIPLLPPSPYKVDSPDAESLWPEGLYFPPSPPIRIAVHDKGPHNVHNYHVGFSDLNGNSIYDPYLLEGVDAVRAFARIKAHGELFHHEIPHIRALLANQRLRLSNGLQPNRLGSIRISSPWHRS